MLAERAVSDWLKNFRPDKWTYKREISEEVISVGDEGTTVQKIVVDEFSPEMLQMTEMLASLMTRQAMTEEIETKLSKAFNLLLKEAYPESGRFFLGASGQSGEQAWTTAMALRAIDTFNRHASEKSGVTGLDRVALRDYLLM